MGEAGAKPVSAGCTRFLYCVVPKRRKKLRKPEEPKDPGIRMRTGGVPHRISSLMVKHVAKADTLSGRGPLNGH